MELVGRPGAEHGVVSPARTDPRGINGPTKRQATGSEWRRSSRGLYVPTYVERTPEQRIVEVGALLPRNAGLTGWAGLRWCGGRWFSGLEPDGLTPRPVPLAVSRHRVRAQDGMTLCEERFDSREVTVVDGIAVTNPIRSLCFEMRYAGDLRRAVVALDMAAYDDLVSVEEAQSYALLHPSYTGIGQCRDAVPLGDENTWSPMEVLMRLVWSLDAGLPLPLTNRPVFDRHGTHLGTPDLIDPEAGVAGEYEGSLHLAAGQRRRDLKREEGFRAHGLECVTMVASDLRGQSEFVGRLRGAYRRTRGVPASRRSWTLEQPSWWEETFTVAQRRALSVEQRATWLRRRAA